MIHHVVFLVFSLMLAGNLAFAQSNDYTVGEIQLPDRCYSSVDVGTVRVIDPDMNADPQKAESVPVYLWANTDVDVRNPNAVETGPDTGIFETAVFLNAYDESFSQRIRALEGDVLYARYVDETVPFDQKQVIETLVTIGALSPQQRWGEPWPERSQLHNSTYVYDACLSEFMDKVGRDNSGLDWLDVTYPAPLKQIESGLFFDEIICKDDFELAFKHDDTPACVTAKTKQKLVERGWSDESSCHGCDKPSFENYKINCDNQLNPYQEYECFKDAYSNCEIATVNPEIYTIEGDPIYTTLSVTSDCKIQGVADMRTDRFWGEPEIIITTCNTIERDEYSWSADNCDAKKLPEMQFNFMMQIYPKVLECKENGNTWDDEKLECIVDDSK